MRKPILIFIFISLIVNIVHSQPEQTYSEKVRFGSRSIDHTRPVHALGIAWHSALTFAPKLKYNSGAIIPTIKNEHTPEFLIHYTCLFPNHFGFTLEVPFGKFQRHAVFDLNQYGAENLYFEAGSFYLGFSPKLAYSQILGEKCSLQAEFGLKFMPFIQPSSYWIAREYYNSNSDIIELSIPGRAYMLPDVTVSMQFLFHGTQRPQNNFVVGIIGNLSFVHRMSISYDTINYGSLPTEAYSSGTYHWNSSAIGLMIGYKFLGLRP